MVRKSIVAGIICLCIASCFPTQKTEKADRNLSYIYNPNTSYIHPDHIVFHRNDSISDLFVRINTNELLFNMANSSSQLASALSFHYEVYQYNDTAGKMLADSGKYDFEIYKNITGKEYIAQIPFKAKYNNTYMLRVFMYDLMRNYWLQTFLPVDKNDRCNTQNFRVISNKNRMYVFNHTVTNADSYRLESKTNRSFKKYYIAYFRLRDRYNVSDAGFVNDMLVNPDSAWTISKSDSAVFSFTSEGSYLIKPDSLCEQGMLLHQFGPNYPDIKTVQELARPLCYLTSIDEYRQIIASSKLKKEIDDFWLKAGGSEERGKQLIKIYYNRVKYSNLYFTSDREGWKTDRGMIYILFGPPSKLYKSDNEEKWIYIGNNTETTFIFRKRNNPYTFNDFIIQPGNTTETLIDEIVDRWLQGKTLF